MTGNKIENKGGMFFASMLQINSSLEKLDLGDCDLVSKLIRRKISKLIRRPWIILLRNQHRKCSRDQPSEFYQWLILLQNEKM
jgi:hypothetical protein